MRRTHQSHSSEEQLILLSAATAARRQSTSEQIGRLAEIVDWSLTAELLRARRLLPLLGVRLVELAGEQAGEEFDRSVTESLETGRRQGAFLQMVGERVTAALADAGIRSTALKGPTLSEALYGDPGRRPSSDIDLLVAREQLHDAVDVVRKLGYRAHTEHIDERGLPLLHFMLSHEHDALPPVELHWRIHWYERSFASERLLAPGGTCAGDWRPAPIDELAALLLFYARDGFIDLRLATDIGACWDAVGAGLEPGSLDGPIRAYPALGHALLVSAKVAETTVGLPLSRLSELGAASTRRDRLAARLASPRAHASQPQFYADIGLIDGLLAPRGGFSAFVRRQIFPPREVLREYAEHAPEQRVSSPIGHGMRVLGRYALAIARLLRISASTHPR